MQLATSAHTESTPLSTWNKVDHGDGTSTYTLLLLYWQTSGSTNATALGFPTPPPEGPQPAIPADFASSAIWSERLDHFIVNGQDWGYGSGTPPSSGGGAAS